MSLAIVLPVLLGVSACKDKKDGLDERVYGRWKITEYYLDNQPAYDSITKYFEGYEYEIGTYVDPSQYPGANSYIHAYHLDEHAAFQIYSFSDYGLSFPFYSTLVPPPPCTPLNVTNGDTIRGCFECGNTWGFHFENSQRMVCDAKNTPNSPLEHSHRLIFTKVGE